MFIKMVQYLLCEMKFSSNPFDNCLMQGKSIWFMSSTTKLNSNLSRTLSGIDKLSGPLHYNSSDFACMHTHFKQNLICRPQIKVLWILYKLSHSMYYIIWEEKLSV